LIYPYQITESYNLGADFILLIATCLSDKKLEELYHMATSMGMRALVEVHNRSELKRSLKIQPEIIGINNRDLKTFSVDINNSLRLRELIPDHIHVISESGIQSHKDIVKLKRNGFAGALIGESLLKQKNPGKALRRLING
jgi:indole-3-glycerol phosphate synthase